MSGRQAAAFWITGRETGEIRGCELPRPAKGEVLVRSLYGGISRGTEALVFRGAVPPSQHAAMRAPHQEGDFPWPVKYGYSNVGLVEEGAAALRGRPVFCLYPHQDRYVVPDAAVVPLPEGLPPQRAVLAANMETAINGLWDGTPRAGDRIAVIGGGTVGCLLVHLAASIPGCRVTLIDIDPDKAALAAHFGADFAIPKRAGGDYDLLFHASGQPEGLATALDSAGFEATVVELSWYGDRAVPLNLGEAFHSRRIVLRSSQVAHLPAAQRGRWTHRRRLELALSLLADDRLDRLITGESAFRDLPAVMQDLCRQPAGVLCHRIGYPE